MPGRLSESRSTAAAGVSPLFCVEMKVEEGPRAFQGCDGAQVEQVARAVPVVPHPISCDPTPPAPADLSEAPAPRTGPSPQRVAHSVPRVPPAPRESSTAGRAAVAPLPTRARYFVPPAPAAAATACVLVGGPTWVAHSADEGEAPFAPLRPEREPSPVLEDMGEEDVGGDYAPHEDTAGGDFTPRAWGPGH